MIWVVAVREGGVAPEGRRRTCGRGRGGEGEESEACAVDGDGDAAVGAGGRPGAGAERGMGSRRLTVERDKVSVLVENAPFRRSKAPTPGWVAVDDGYPSPKHGCQSERQRRDLVETNRPGVAAADSSRRRPRAGRGQKSVWPAGAMRGLGEDRGGHLGVVRRR